MKLVASALVLIAGLSLFSNAIAAEPFTPEQYKEIEKLLAAERIRIKAEVRKEVLTELAQGKLNAEERQTPALTPRNGDMPEEPTAPLKGDLGLATADQVFSTRGSGIELSAAAGDGDAAIMLARSESGTRNGRF